MKVKDFGWILIIIGFALLVTPIAIPYSVFQAGPVVVSGISERAAISMGAGVVLLLIGIALVFKKNLFK